MTKLTALLAATALMTTAGLVQADDLSLDETNKLVAAGTIQSIEKLNEAALALHPGASIDDTELEKEYGRYIYQVEVRDAKGVEWDVELDATNAEVLKNHQDN